MIGRAERASSRRSWAIHTDGLLTHAEWPQRIWFAHWI
jgi:hypothetical protein